MQVTFDASGRLVMLTDAGELRKVDVRRGGRTAIEKALAKREKEDEQRNDAEQDGAA